MRIDEPEAEGLLRRTLADNARTATSDLTFAEIRDGAARQAQQARRRRASYLAAAAVVAVIAPTAFLLRPSGHEPSPAPAPSPSGKNTPSASPSPSPTPPSSASSAASKHFLQQLPRSADPRIGYLYGSTIHLSSGGTTVMPGPTSVSAYAAYHGGWLVGDGVMPGVRWYDNTGALKQQGLGAYQIAVSPDGMRVAYQLRGRIRIGIATGMGQGEDTIAVRSRVDAWPVGFLSDGALVYMDSGTVLANQPMSTPFPTSMAQADVVSVDDVVAGEDDQHRGMAWSSRTGTMLWSSSPWVVGAFSSDGRYAAATSAHDDGSSAVAILDTRSGAVIAQHSFSAQEVQASFLAAFDTDGSLLVSVTDVNEDRAVLRLTRQGALSRATDVLVNDQSSDPVTIVFAAGP